MNEGKVKLIIDYVRGRVGTDFQLDLNVVLYEYWQYRGSLFESVSWFGGDKKNDGWVKELGIFYQVYSPRYLSASFKQDIQNKFYSDLAELSKLVFEKKLWNKIISKFVFIVNDKGLGLPEDSVGFYESKVDEINIKYAQKITHQIMTLNDIHNILFEIKDTFHIDRLISKLNLNQNLTAFSATAMDILKFIEVVATNIGEAYACGVINEFSRISTDKKLQINNFVKYYESIQNKLSKLTVVDMAFKEMNLETSSSKKFEAVKDYFITEYERLSKNYCGDDLYEEMLRITHDITNNYPVYSKAGELVLLYIFDRCDIFLKEEKNDTTK